MQIFKLKSFARWAKGVGITDKKLKDAVKEMHDGLVDAELGSELFKKRISRTGQGKSSGYRVLLAFKRKKLAIFLFGFGKNELSNIDNFQLNLLKKLSTKYLNLDENSLLMLMRDGTLVKVK